MPSYALKCPSCGFEETRFNIRIERADRQKCVQCNAVMVRVVTAPNVVFKGDGWTPRHHGPQR